MLNPFCVEHRSTVPVLLDGLDHELRRVDFAHHDGFGFQPQPTGFYGHLTSTCLGLPSWSGSLRTTPCSLQEKGRRRLKPPTPGLSQYPRQGEVSSPSRFFSPFVLLVPFVVKPLEFPLPWRLRVLSADAACSVKRA